MYTQNTQIIKPTECCPIFNPEPWDGKIFEWDNKKFIKDEVFSLFYIPMNFGAVVKRMMAKIEKAEVKTPDWMGLSDHTSRWNMDLYVAVDRNVPDAKNVTISGKFLSKVYEGDFKETGKWRKDFEKYAENKGLKIKKIYMWYTTCPKCAKAYGKNYVVLFARIN